MKNGIYHYTECGLDTVFLVNGFEYVDTREGRRVLIHDLDGLQRTIGLALVCKRQRLTEKEFRFLRSELLLSQARLAKILGVKDLTVGRWERGETEIPLYADAIVRTMFRESVGESGQMRELLEWIADLDDEIDHTLTLREKLGEWGILEEAA